MFSPSILPEIPADLELSWTTMSICFSLSTMPFSHQNKNVPTLYTSVECTLGYFFLLFISFLASIPRRPPVKCGLSLLLLLLVLVLAPRRFSSGTPVFPSPQKPTFPNSIRSGILSVTAYTVKCHPH